MGPIEIRRWKNQRLPGKDCEASETIEKKTPKLQTTAVSFGGTQDGVVTSGVPVRQCAES